VLSRSSRNCVFTFLPSRTLFQQLVASIGQHPELSVLDAHEPVSKAAANSSVDGVDPERLLVEERAHLNAELPQSCSDACNKPRWLASALAVCGGGEGITETAPEEDLVDHGDVWEWYMCPCLCSRVQLTACG
jgi:hypothetical protein